jgi:hypothetical protein
MTRSVPHHWLLAAGIACALAISGCQGIGPVEPTVVRLPTQTPLPEPTGPQVTAPFPTLPPTWTPGPTKTELPTIPPKPAVPTHDQTADAPINVINNGNGAAQLSITEAQLNAALKRKFDDAPLANYTDAPHVTLGDGSLIMTLPIVPLNAPSGSSPQTMTLIADFAIYDNALELDPTNLSPSDVGVTTLQVKLGHTLLMQTLNELVHTASNIAGPLSYNYVSIAPDKVSLTVVEIGQ